MATYQFKNSTYDFITIPAALKDFRTVPLVPMTKAAAAKWAFDNPKAFDGNYDKWYNTRLHFYNRYMALTPEKQEGYHKEQEEKGFPPIPMNPDAVSGYGVILKKTGVMIIDIDVNHSDGIDGLASFDRFLKDHDIAGVEAFDTLQTRTANGGIHIYLKQGELPEGIERLKSGVNSVLGDEYEGIDLKIDEAYVVGSGSKVYRDQDAMSGETGVYTTLKDAPQIMDAPQFIMDALIENAYQRESGTSTKSGGIGKRLPKPRVSRQGVWKTSEGEAELSTNQLSLLNDRVNDLSMKGQGERNLTISNHSWELGVNGIHPEIVYDRLSPIALSIGVDQKEIDDTVPRCAEEGYAKFLEDQKANEEHKNKFSHLEQLDEDGWTDVAVAKYGIDNFNILYVPKRRSFAIYVAEEGIWEMVRDAAVVGALIIEKLRADLKERDVDGDKKIREKMYVLNFQKSVGEAVASFRKTRVMPEAFDSADRYIHFANGVLDGKTGELMPHDPKYRFLSSVGHNYRPEARHEVVDVILSALPDDAHDWVQLMAGQALAGYQTAKHYNIFFVGDGSNGKSVLMNMLHKTGGSFSARPSQQALSVNGDQFALAGYARARQAVIEELPSQKLDGDRLKSLAGTDVITTRGMREDVQEIKNRLTLFISANSLPDILQLDGGALRRPVIVPFEKTYKNNPPAGSKSVLPADSRVVSAANDIEVLEAFIAWRVEGYLRWMQSPDRAQAEANQPASIANATYAWRAEAEPLNVFVYEELVFSKQHGVSVQQLMHEYSKWSENQGISKRAQLSAAKLTTILLRQYKHDLAVEPSMPANIDPSLTSDSYAPEFKHRQKCIVGLAFRGTVVEQEEVDEMISQYTSEEGDPLELNDLLEDADDLTF